MALELQHRAALRWYEQNRGRVVTWPEPLPDGTLLAARPKGIYKPQWSKYALSVREILESRYPDREPVAAEGTWLYVYHQEGPASEPPTRRFTNAGLVACMRDGVPIGVLRELPASGVRRYAVLGLARVFNYDAGFFFLEGIGGLLEGAGAADARIAAEEPVAFDPDLAGLLGDRVTASGVIVRRPGQVEFRRSLVAAYGGKCAVTAYDAVPALQAAHVIPYEGSVTDHLQNGLLLRADIHVLFDRHLLRIDPDEYCVELHPDLRTTKYRPLHGGPVVLPHEDSLRPSREALAMHAQRCSY